MADLGPPAEVDAIAFQRNKEFFRSFLDRPEVKDLTDGLCCFQSLGLHFIFALKSDNSILAVCVLGFVTGLQVYFKVNTEPD